MLVVMMMIGWMMNGNRRIGRVIRSDRFIVLVVTIGIVPLIMFT